MKLFGDASGISKIWRECKENNIERMEKSTHLKYCKNKMVAKKTFRGDNELDKLKKSIVNSNEMKEDNLGRTINPDTPSFEQSTIDSYSNTMVNDSIVSSENKNVINKKLRHSSLKISEKPKSFSTKTNLHRGKSDTRPNRNTRRHTDYGLSSLYCRTEFKIPGEFLFCSHIDHSNSFASVYRRISTGGNLRRSFSTGTISEEGSSKHKGDFTIESTYSPQVLSSKRGNNDGIRATRSKSCVIRDTCTKMYTATNAIDKELKRQSREILAVELQNIIDKKENIFSKENGRYQKTEIEKSNSNEKISDNKKLLEDALKVSGQNLNNSKSIMNRRSQSCKGTDRRRSNLFNISRYLKDRNTQRSKSFATIRQFSTGNTKRTNSVCLDGRFESRNVNDTSIRKHDQHINNKKHFQISKEQSPGNTLRNFDINHTDSRGNSCLHHASSQGDTRTLKYLLEHGGNVWVKNDEHRLPIDIAQNFQTAKLLSSATLFYSEHSGQRNERNIMQTSKLNIAL